MSACLCCGDKRGYRSLSSDAIMRRLSVKGDFHCCSWCEDKVAELTPDAARALVELDKIRPAFKVWRGGRREDSGEAAGKSLALPVPQPAQIAPFAEPGLFVGDLDDVKNVPLLRELGIGFILNLCPEHLNGEYADLPAQLAQDGIKQLTWPAEDSWNFDIVDKVVNQGACDFIEMGLRSAGVLVNCWGGVNRSACVAVAYLVLRKQLCLVGAVKQAMAQRGTVLTNRYFRWLLVKAAVEADCPLHDSRVGREGARLSVRPSVQTDRIELRGGTRGNKYKLSTLREFRQGPSKRTAAGWWRLRLGVTF